MKLEAVSISKLKTDIGRWGSVILVASAAICSPYILFLPNRDGNSWSNSQPTIAGESAAQTHRVCVKCGHTKKVGHGGDFAIKGRSSSGIRWDSVCLVCKAQAQKLRRQKPESRSTDVRLTSKRIIEPHKKLERFEKSDLFETQRLALAADFGDLEGFYDKSLDHQERVAVVQRFNEFITILREGLGDLLGSEVYVSKDE